MANKVAKIVHFKVLNHLYRENKLALIKFLNKMTEDEKFNPQNLTTKMPRIILFLNLQIKKRKYLKII